jgi:hypothetical protein
MSAIWFVLAMLVQTSQTASIGGTIVNAATNESIPRATVVLLADTDRDRRYVRTVISDSDGRFVISNITPGAYKVSVSYTGYAPPPMKSLILTAGQDVHDVLIKLTQFGVISGRVVSPGGDPISDITSTRKRANSY